VPGLLARLLEDGYHAGLHLGRWYPELADSFTVAVTEKRSRAEIDGLAAAFSGGLSNANRNGSASEGHPATAGQH
jgi:glycine dehydrogenase subunit 1